MSTRFILQSLNLCLAFYLHCVQKNEGNGSMDEDGVSTLLYIQYMYIYILTFAVKPLLNTYSMRDNHDQGAKEKKIYFMGFPRQIWEKIF